MKLSFSNTLSCITGLLLATFFSGCSQSGPSGSAGEGTDTGADAGKAAQITYPYRIVTTCGMVTDIVQQVAGEHGKVDGLMGEGVDPHLYKPTRDDIAKLSEAEVIFYSGLMLEGRMADTFSKMSRKGVSVFAVTELLQEDYLMEPEEFDGHWDPHVWNDVKAWISAVDAVAKSLSEFDPSNSEKYAANAAAYNAELQKLDDYAKKSIASIPEPQRVLITAHDAFGYFSRAYGIKVMSAQGVTTMAEAAISDINKIVEFVVKNKVSAIFIENIVSDRNVNAIVEGAKAQGHNLEIGGELFSDAMGPSGTYEGTYLGMVDHNITLITRKLGGEAPEKGLNGKLTHAE